MITIGLGRLGSLYYYYRTTIPAYCPQSPHREVHHLHHMYVLLGYGTEAVCPFMVFEIAHMLRNKQLIDPEITDAVVYENYAAAVERGISKVNTGL